MKKTAILLLSIAALMSFTQCNSSSSNELFTNAATRGKAISTLLNNEVYMSEVMDSMQTKHHAAMAKNDKAMQTEMMDKMMAMCKSDTAMCKMMMGKTMDMCDADASRCNMMMGEMKTRPNVKKSMEGMCDMKGMK